MRRVVVTGMGVVSAIGLGAEAFGASLRAGRSGITRLRGENTQGFPFELGGEVHGFEPDQWLRTLEPRQVGRTSQFAIAAARMAVEDGGIHPAALRRGGCGVSVGTTDGESFAADAVIRAWLADGPRGLDGRDVGRLPADRISLAVARELGLEGEAVTLSTACAAGNYAIGNAFDVIRSGEAECMLCGGAESVARKSLAAFYTLGAIAPQVCQPFDANRRGIMIGEGAGMLLLESLDFARARGPDSNADVYGGGW